LNRATFNHPDPLILLSVYLIIFYLFPFHHHHFPIIIIIIIMDKNMLADATNQDDSPTPGYMLVDIASKLIMQQYSLSLLLS
jgi:hypothetical protein